MQLTTLLTTALAGTAAAAAVKPTLGNTPALYDLQIADRATVPNIMYTNVMYANSSAFIGNVKYKTYSEPLLLTGGSPEYMHSFTSFHASPTGWQNLYILPAESRPVSFTTPHSAYFPPGAQRNGFGVVEGRLAVQGEKGVEEKWVACPVKGEEGTMQIFWEGGEKLEGCKKVALKVGEQSDCRWPRN